jgi:hypothetical protein
MFPGATGCSNPAATGITYYPVPPEFGFAQNHRYAIVYDYVVLIDPATREVVQVVE